MNTNLILLSHEEYSLRLSRIQQYLADAAVDCAIISSMANLFYLTGRVFCGYAAVYPSSATRFFVKRPVHLTGPDVTHIHKPEEMAPVFEPAQNVGLELASLSYNMAQRLIKITGGAVDISGTIAKARSRKTPHEIALLTVSGAKHERVYRKIPHMYRPGMSDIELQIEIERISRLEGCLGQFRIAGSEMELHMGNVLAGDNADAPSPYDFAMGGAGADPSLPVGADGSIIRTGMSVMVDMNGNFTGYMTDMTRTFSLGQISDEAVKAHRLSIDICRTLADMGLAGTKASDLYDKALQMAKDAGLDQYFMGHRQHAAFVGHGLGIEINELPVISPRSRDILAPGNVIALEPKFVIPGTGAVGIENTYVVAPDGPMECLTRAPQDIIQFDR